jgi:hypothetical protein
VGPTQAVARPCGRRAGPDDGTAEDDDDSAPPADHDDCGPSNHVDHEPALHFDVHDPGHHHLDDLHDGAGLDLEHDIRKQ